MFYNIKNKLGLSERGIFNFKYVFNYLSTNTEVDRGSNKFLLHSNKEPLFYEVTTDFGVVSHENISEASRWGQTNLSCFQKYFVLE